MIYILMSLSYFSSVANAEGYFNAEIAPVEVKVKKGKEMFSVDEHPRQTTIEKLSSLPPVFKENGTVSAGNASGICDGAGSLVVASEETISKYNLTPLARVVGYGLTGVDPTIMGIGPVNAVRSLLSIAGLTLNNIELVEVKDNSLKHQLYYIMRA